MDLHEEKFERKRELALSRCTIRIILLFILALPLHAQETFYMRYRTGLATEDPIWPFLALSEVPGGYLIAGGTNDDRAFVVRAGQDGHLLWSRGYDFSTSSQDRFSAMYARDGGLMLVGNILTGDGRDMLMTRTDSAGSVLWTRRYYGSKADRIFSISPARDQGFLVLGTTASFDTTKLMACLLRTDSTGHIAEARVLPGSSFRSIIVLPGRGFAISGGRELAMLDSNGDVAWCRRYDSMTVNSVQADGEGFLLAGRRVSGRGFVLARADGQGRITGARLYEGAMDPVPVTLARFGVGWFIGATAQVDIDAFVSWVAITDSSGNIQSAWSLRGESALAAAIPSEKGIAIAGGNGYTGADELFLIRTGEDGHICPEQERAESVSPTDFTVRDSTMELTATAFQLSENDLEVIEIPLSTGDSLYCPVSTGIEDQGQGEPVFSVGPEGFSITGLSGYENGSIRIVNVLGAVLFSGKPDASLSIFEKRYTELGIGRGLYFIEISAGTRRLCFRIFRP